MGRKSEEVVCVGLEVGNYVEAPLCGNGNAERLAQGHTLGGLQILLFTQLGEGACKRPHIVSKLYFYVFVFQLWCIFNIILYWFQVHSTGVRQSYTYQAFPLIFPVPTWHHTISLILSITFLMLYFMSP